MNSLDLGAKLSPEDRPVYLHFLDRELDESVGARLSTQTVESAVKVLVLATDAQLYCGLSLVWEHPAAPALQTLISSLVEAGQLDLVSHHAGGEDFLSSRRALYSHDQSRYPLYFAAESPTGLGATQFKIASTTLALAHEYESLLGGQPGLARASGALPSRAMNLIENAIAERGDRALTYALFEDTAQAAIDPSISWPIRRSISLAYTEHYLDFLSGDVATGLPGLQLYDDSLARGFPFHDVKLLAHVLALLGLSGAVQQPWTEHRTFWEGVISSRYGRRLCFGIANLIRCATAEVSYSPNKTGTRSRIASRCSAWLTGTAPRRAKKTLSATLIAATDWVERAVSIASQSPTAADALATAFIDSQPQADVLLVTATEVEYVELQRSIKRRYGREGLSRTASGIPFTDFGTIDSNRIWHVECQMGSSSPAGSLVTVLDSIGAIRPGAVIMLGIAFAFDETESPLSTVLVSEQLFDYGSVRASTGPDGELVLEARGPRVPADGKLVQHARRSARARSPQIGLLVSGPVLIDHAGFRDAIADLPMARDALGGEMEGAGLYVAAHRRKKPWLVVKAVCDFADGRKKVEKSKRQHAAAEASAHVVLDILDRLGPASAL